MHTNKKTSIKMKVFQKGQVVIPVALREKYLIEIGDQINIIPTEEGILLKSVPKHENQKSLTEKLFGIFSSYSTEKKQIEKQKISNATEKGFIERWQK